MFYYELLLQHGELCSINSQKVLRQLELLSLPGREKRVPESPLPWQHVPLYFRRAAANTGIAAAKSYLSREEKRPGRKAQRLNAAVVYYKGMYRDFSADEITLKVWDKEQWRWLRCRLYGKEFPEEAQMMSPSVVFEYKFAMLHVPIKETVADTSTVKERLKEGRNFCSIQFTNSDAFAVGSISDVKGKELAVKFFKGGKEYSHHCRRIVEKIEQSIKSLGNVQGGRPNQKYWMHLKHLGEHYAHEVSKQIVEFCGAYEAAVIVLPKYEKAFTNSVMYGSGDWSPMHLSTRIREFLFYKAWKNGILVIEVYAKGIGTVCAKCGKEIIKTDIRTGEYFCQGGHRGNRSLNASRNLGKKYLIQFGKAPKQRPFI